MTDDLPALTVEQRKQITELFSRRIFEINLEDEDLVFYAECLESDDEEFLRDSDPSDIHSIEEIARVPFHIVISHAIFSCAEWSDDDDDLRSGLFAISGRLREMAKFVEGSALEASEVDFGDETIPLLLPQEVREQDAERELLADEARERERARRRKPKGPENGNGHN